MFILKNKAPSRGENQMTTYVRINGMSREQYDREIGRHWKARDDHESLALTLEKERAARFPDDEPLPRPEPQEVISFVPYTGKSPATAQECASPMVQRDVF